MIPLPIPLTEPQRAEAGHRLNNPLAIIQGHAELLVMYPDEGKQVERARVILKAAKRMKEELKRLFGI
jgi:nitrogen-specific signal transduction histidine kinase